MNGQWLGSFISHYPEGIKGPGEGQIVLDLDETKDAYEGIAHLDFPKDLHQLPSMEIWCKTTNKETATNISSYQISVVDRETGLLKNWEEIKHHYPNILMPKTISGKASLIDGHLVMTWRSDIGTSGSCRLPQSNADKVSEIKAIPLDWDGYKKYVNTLEGGGRLFRGQNEPWRLRTSFHREGRAHVLRYMVEDLPALHRALSAKTRHFFNLNDHDQLWAFLNLIQHHGYPTPLLDWTYSPYVAAFFAYRGLSSKHAAATPNQNVRIYIFDHERWRLQFQQISHVVARILHVSVVEPFALENERSIPQQAALLSSTVDDIESYLKLKIGEDQSPFLTAIELPWGERDRVVNELHYMGINAGSMFPGLDGTCEELKERNFRMR